MINSLTCSEVHLCHFVCYVHFLHSYIAHAWMGFYNSQMFMVQCTISPHSLHVVYCTEAVQTLRGCQTNHEDRIVPVVSGGGPVPADLPLCLLHG